MYVARARLEMGEKGGRSGRVEGILGSANRTGLL